MGEKSATQKAIELVQRGGILRPRDLRRHGIVGEHLRRLVRRGQLSRVGTGLYTLPDSDMSEHRSLVEACTRVPHGVICLLSALRFHGLSSQNPSEVWMAIPHKSWRPRGKGPPLRIVHLTGAAMTRGVEMHRLEGVMVRIFNPAKTVADCFKFRNKIGLDVALDALRDYRKRHRSGMDDLWRYAKICRVSKVMRPYLEMLS